MECLSKEKQPNINQNEQFTIHIRTIKTTHHSFNSWIVSW